jgi:hypothetical protein
VTGMGRGRQVAGILMGMWLQQATPPPPPPPRAQVPEGGVLVSGVYQLLSSGTLPSDHQHHPSRCRRRPAGDAATLKQLAFTTAGWQLASAYREADGHEPALTNKHRGFAGCLVRGWYARPATPGCRCLGAHNAASTLNPGVCAGDHPATPSPPPPPCWLQDKLTPPCWLQD